MTLQKVDASSCIVVCFQANRRCVCLCARVIGIGCLGYRRWQHEDDRCDPSEVQASAPQEKTMNVFDVMLVAALCLISWELWFK